MTKRKIDIHKAGGIIIVDRKVLVERSKHKVMFIHPGGKIEPGETPKQALVRELEEEFTIRVKEADLEYFDTFYAEAAGNPGKWVQMDIFTVRKFAGTIQPASEVEEIAFVNSNIPQGMEFGSIVRHETIPRLKKQKFID